MEQMSLDEAIEHLNEKILEISCENCKREHEQLRAWLVELKEKRHLSNI